MAKIGISDTTFSNVDMAKIATDIIKSKDQNHELIRYTVPGIKDLPSANNILFKKYSCDIILSLGMVGKEEVDKVCGHEASTANQLVQINNTKHIIEAFVHMDEGKDNEDLYQLTKNRVEKHAINTLKLLEGPTALQEKAGHGLRQGRDDIGKIK